MVFYFSLTWNIYHKVNFHMCLYSFWAFLYFLTFCQIFVFFMNQITAFSNY